MPYLNGSDTFLVSCAHTYTHTNLRKYWDRCDLGDSSSQNRDHVELGSSISSNFSVHVVEELKVSGPVGLRHVRWTTLLLIEVISYETAPSV